MSQRLRRKINVLVLFVAVLIPIATFGAPVILDPSGPASAEVIRVSETFRETVLELQLGSVLVDTVEGPPNRVAISAAGTTPASQSGWPEVPQVSVWIRGAESSQLEIVSTAHHAYSWGTVQPAAEPLLRSATPAISRSPAAEFYSGTAAFPATPAAIVQNASLRGARVLLVTFSPVQYDPQTGVCTVHSRIRVRISHGAGHSLDRTVPTGRATHVLLERLRATGTDDHFPVDPSSPRLIIVTETSFLGALQPLINWKRRAGLPVLLVRYSQVASSAPQLREYLTQLYDSLPVPPDYLLLVGDIGVIPTFTGIDNSLTDHPYSTLSGGDYLPDISVGRLPCQTAAECAAWVGRILDYERNGSTVPSANATVVSSSSAFDPRHGITVRNLFQNAGLATEHLQQPQSNSLAQLSASLNAGREWVFYIGHGYAQGWTSVNPPFENPHVQPLQNIGGSVVVSVACATADPDYPGHSLGVHWVNQSSGPVAYFGATEPTAFFYSDTLGLGVVRAVFSDDVDQLGLAADLGRLATAQAFPQPAGGLTEETIQQFVLLGDPSMRVFSSTPTALEVNYPQSLPLGTTQFMLTVQHDGQPVSAADVCVSADASDFYTTASTDAGGSATFQLGLIEPAVLHVTVTARNAVPYTGTLQIVPADAAFLQVAALAVSDSAGDRDGRADRGESCQFRVALTNLGSLPSAAGSLRISSLDPNVSISSTLVEWSAVSPGDTVWSDMTVPFTVSGTVPDLTSVMIRVCLTPLAGDSVVTFLPLQLHAPRLTALYASVLTEHYDGRPLPDNHLLLRVLSRNAGSDLLRATRGLLASSSPLITIGDSTAICDVVAAGDTLSLLFPLEVPADLPRGHPFEFSVRFTGENLPTEARSGRLRLRQVPVLLHELDRQPQQIDGIAQALASLGIEFGRDTVLPVDLGAYASVWTFCGVFPNQQTLTASDGARLASYLQDGGRCYLEGGDTWAFDAPTPVHSMFRITGVNDGTSNTGPVSGEYGTSYQGLSFSYGGENNFIDQLAPVSGAQVILRNDRTNATYPVCIAYAGDGYRTVGSSIELGAVGDSSFPSTRVNLVRNILEWFEISAPADVFPPQISHQPLRQPARPGRPVSVTADIQDASGVGFAEVLYRVNDGGMATASMSLAGGLYRTLLPASQPGDTVRYRIRAGDASPLGTWTQTDIYTLAVQSNGKVPLQWSLEGASRFDLAPQIVSGAGGSWSIVEYPDGRPMLELHGGPGEAITFDTEEIDCSSLNSGRVSFDHYLRVNGSFPGSVVRVLGSTDGGRSFPHTVWELPHANRFAQEGTITARDQRWMAGRGSVVLRFEFRNDWYWRIGSVTVHEDGPDSTIAVSGVTIHASRTGVRLFWPRVAGAMSYEVFGSAERNSAFEPLTATADTTYVDVGADRYDFRLYQVHAIMSVAAGSTVQQARFRPADFTWNRKLERLGR